MDDSISKLNTAKQIYTHGSLFSGVGGFDLGFERAGFKTVFQVEIDPYCRKVLEKNFPHAKRYSDIRDCHDLPGVDVISGGFPCQDISNAGKRIGIDGERSGLWSEMWRVIREVRPRFVIVENVAALLGRGMERVLGDLAEGGYDAEWDVLPAAAFGAPHIRERVFIVAYASGDLRRTSRNDGPKPFDGSNPLLAHPSVSQLRNESRRSCGESRSDTTKLGNNGTQEYVADTAGSRRNRRTRKQQSLRGRPLLSTRSSGCGEDVANSQRAERRQDTSSRYGLDEEQRLSQGQEGASGTGSSGQDVAYANERQRIAGDSKAGNGRTISSQGQEWEFRGSSGWQDVADSNGNNGNGWSGALQMGRSRIAEEIETDGNSARTQWSIEPNVGRVAHGVPARVDRLKGLGNAVVPQIAQWIAERIKQVEGEHNHGTA